MDRRAVFFALMSLVCFVLVPVAQDAYREITLGVGVTYVVLAGASALDHWSKHRR
jgi:hypothetical protein